DDDQLDRLRGGQLPLRDEPPARQHGAVLDEGQAGRAVARDQRRRRPRPAPLRERQRVPGRARERHGEERPDPEMEQVAAIPEAGALQPERLRWVEQRAVARGQVMLVLPAQRFDRVPAHAAALRAGEKAARLARTNCVAAISCHAGSVTGRGTPVPEGPPGTTRLAQTSRASYAPRSMLSRRYGPHAERIVLPRGRSRRGESLT